MDFLGFSVVQLKDCQKKRGINGYSKWKRDDLKEKLVIWQDAWNEANATAIAERQQLEE
jgi:hypothetical protein